MSEKSQIAPQPVAVGAHMRHCAAAICQPSNGVVAIVTLMTRHINPELVLYRLVQC